MSLTLPPQRVLYRSQKAAQAGHVDHACSQKGSDQDRVNRGLQKRSKEPPEESHAEDE